MGRHLGQKDKMKRATREEFVKISQWVSNNRDKLLEERPALTTLAEKLNKQFGCIVNPQMLRSIQELTGTLWEPKLHRKDLATSSTAALRHRHRVLAYRQRLLVEALNVIVTEIGMAVPEALRRLINEDQGDEDATSTDLAPRTIPITSGLGAGAGAGNGPTNGTNGNSGGNSSNYF